MSPRLASTLALALATAVSATARAQTSNPARSPWSASFEIGPAWHHDPSYQTFLRGREVPPVGGLSFGRDLAHLGPSVSLAAEVGWRLESTSGRVRQAFDTQLVTNHLQAAVTLRVEALSWLAPYVRVAGGAAHLSANFEDDQSNLLTAREWAPYGAAGAGVLVTSGRWFQGIGARTLRLAIAVEGGYQLVAPTTLRVAKPAPSDERAANDAVAAQPASLGTLDPSSAYLRVVMGVRF